MFKKVLVANRGEIAMRILRACKELGVASVVAYSEADRDTLAVRMADQAVCIGPPAVEKSYLHIPAIMSAAHITGADAIHPGYGFLSENPYVAEICEKLGITFIGPAPKVIEQMSDKALARELMRRAGLPVIPGSDAILRSAPEARERADETGYPVLLKAVAGGGGRGMRVVEGPADVETAFAVAGAEARAAFGNPDLYMEKYLPDPRHVEVQVLADNHGHIVHFGTRDCSLQRRHQKMLEEAPAPGLDAKLLARIADMAVKGCRSIGYQNAGTLEFLVTQAGEFYFMEMNTRIQVEHGITEMLTGVDLVKWQIRIAAGEALTLAQKEIKLTGHAIECRINAEDPGRGFLPQVGVVDLYNPPGGPGVRVDSHLYSGYTVPANYDSLLGKIMVCGQDRAEAIARMDRALGECIIVGLTTTIPFHQRLLRHPDFVAGRLSTRSLERWAAEGAQAAALAPQPPAAGTGEELTSVGTAEAGNGADSPERVGDGGEPDGTGSARSGANGRRRAAAATRRRRSGSALGEPTPAAGD